MVNLKCMNANVLDDERKITSNHLFVVVCDFCFIVVVIFFFYNISSEAIRSENKHRFFFVCCAFLKPIVCIFDLLKLLLALHLLVVISNVYYLNLTYGLSFLLLLFFFLFRVCAMEKPNMTGMTIQYILEPFRKEEVNKRNIQMHEMKFFNVNVYCGCRNGTVFFFQTQQSKQSKPVCII